MVVTRVKEQRSRYVFYFPVKPIQKEEKGSKNSESGQALSLTDFEKAIGDKVYEYARLWAGATTYIAQGRTGWGEEHTIVLEVISVKDQIAEARIEQLGLLILAFINQLRKKQGLPREKELWYYRSGVELTKLREE